jgi:hypothetical protein
MSVRRYLDSIHSKFGYLATWLPNTPLRLGDVGRWTDTGFQVETSLRRLGVSVKRRKGTAMGRLDHTSLQSVQAKIGATSEAAGISLGFGEAGGFVFQAEGCAVEQIDDFDAMGIELLDLFRQKLWKPEWIVVDTIVRVARATILVSESDNATVEIKGPTDLSDLVEVDLAVTAQSGSITRFIGEAAMTPLFRARRVKKGFLGLLPDTIEPMRSDDRLPTPEFDALTPGDLFGDG